MLLGQWGKFLVLTKIGGYISKSICFFFLQEEIRLLLLFSHPDFFVIFEALVDVTSELWALHLKTKKQKTRSLYVAQAGLEPPILLPALPTRPPMLGFWMGTTKPGSTTFYTHHSHPSR